MDRAPTQRRAGRNVGFAPVAQNDSDLEAADDVSQYWELPVNQPRESVFHSRVRDIFRNTALGQFDEDEGLQHIAADTAQIGYAPVESHMALDGLEEATIAELAGPGPMEYYAPYAPYVRGHNRAPSALSGESDTLTEKTFVEREQLEEKDKFLRFEPMVTTIEVDDDIPSKPTPTELPDYKPAALKRRFLLILFSAVVALLAFMITALFVLPKSSSATTSDVISRNASEIKPRSHELTQRSVRLVHGLDARKHDDSGSSSAEISPSDDEQISIPTLGITLTVGITLTDPDVTTTTPETTTTTSKVSDKTTTPKSEPSEIKTEPSTSPETSTTTSSLHTTSTSTSTRTGKGITTSTTTSTTAAEEVPTPTDAEPNKPSKGGDDKSPTTVKETTATTSTTTTSLTTTSSKKPDPAENDSTTSSTTSSTTAVTTTKKDPEPSDGGHGSGGDKGHAGGGNDQSPSPGYTPTSTVSTSSQSSESSTLNTDPTSSHKAGGGGPMSSKESDPTSQAETTATATVVVPTSQKPPGDDSKTLSTSSLSSDGDVSLPSSTATNPPGATCTVEVVQTVTSWITVPVLTIDLGLIKKFVPPQATRLGRREAARCDTTVTTTLSTTTLLITTAPVTVTIGIPPVLPTSPTSPASPTSPGENPGTTSTTSFIPTNSGAPTPTDTSVVNPGTTGPSTVSEVTTGTTTNAADSPTVVPGGESTPTTTLPSSQPVQQSGSPTSSENAGGATLTNTTPATTAQATGPNDPNSTEAIPTFPGEVKTTPSPETTAASAPPASEGSGAATASSSMTTTISVVVPPPPTSTVITVIHTTTNSDSSLTTSTFVSTIVISVSTPVDSGGQRPPGTLPNQGSTTVQHTVTLPTPDTHNTGPGHADPSQGGDNDHRPPPPETPTHTPTTTVVRVIESTRVVSSIESTVTPTSTVTDKSGLIAVGNYITTVPITAAMFVTRLRTTTIDDGDPASGATQVIASSTLTDENGKPTATSLETLYQHLATVIEKDYNGNPTTTKYQIIQETPRTTTMTGLNGRVMVRTYFEDVSTITMTDSRGKITGYQVLHITDLPTVTTLRDAAGNPTSTMTIMMPAGTSTSFSTVVVDPTSTPKANASVANPTIAAVPVSSGYYFLGILLPTLLAIGISIPIRILDQTVKLHQPFSAMTSKEGAETKDSLGLKTTGLWGLISGVLSPKTGNWLLAVTGLLTVVNSILIALSTEALELEVQDFDCPLSSDGRFKTCPTSVVVSRTSAKFAAGLICLMAILIIVVAIGLWQRRTGVENDSPWSIFEMWRLAQDENTLTRLDSLDWKLGGIICKEEVIRAFGKKRYKLGYLENKEEGRWQRVIKMKNDEGEYRSKRTYGTTRICGMPFFTLSLSGRILFFLLQLALALMVLLYRNTHGAFQDFMDSENFGGRFILTGAGVVISIIWWNFFTCVAFLSPYRLMYRKQPFEKVAHLSPPSNPFSGFWRVISREHPDNYLGVVAFTAILSEFLPLFLANVPARLEEQDPMSTACVWLTISVICIMAMVLISSFIISWPPEMPMDPSTVAGAMFYASKNMTSRKRKSSSTLGSRSTNIV
ncbi:hypothetical protein E8E14_007029 [Neopestalotiopsis sp. 37M]|nr:hypothetical protein E8E14_007029 [Neopestalotiopsis sp. 37M]